MNKSHLEIGSWIAGIVSAIVAVIALMWQPKPEAVSQPSTQTVTTNEPSPKHVKPTPQTSSTESSNVPALGAKSKQIAHCPTKAAIIAASGKAEDISYYDERNKVYVSLVQDATCLNDFDLAKTIAGKISYYDIRNSAYKAIIDAALLEGKIEIADAVADEISYYDQRNAAKQKIINAIRASR